MNIIGINFNHSDTSACVIVNNKLIAAVEEYGLWPNDAIMCRQLIKKLGVTRKFYTLVQGLPSTTTE